MSFTGTRRLRKASRRHHSNADRRAYADFAISPAPFLELSDDDMGIFMMLVYATALNEGLAWYRRGRKS